MIVHSFSQENEWFEDDANFLKLFGQISEIGNLTWLGQQTGVDLYVGWVKGMESCLSK